MTKAALKKRIVDLVARRTDQYLLHEVYSILAAETNSDSLRERLVVAVKEGEADIAAGRKMGFATFEKRIEDSLRRKIALRQPRRRRA